VADRELRHLESIWGRMEELRGRHRSII
jgi:hypothetical protein